MDTAASGTQELAGKVALVTGGALNIGRAISLSLSAAGARVAINTLRSRDEAEGLAGEIRADGGEAAVVLADIADASAVKAMADAVVSRFGRIDILVLNASYRKEVLFTDMTFEEWRKVMSITLDGSFHCIKACLPSMLASGGGSIVCLTGDNVLLGGVKKVHNSAAKSGLTGMTRALARELGEQGIRVNCVSPGAINTTRPDYRPPRADAKGRIPLGRWGEAGEIAAAVRFLCGPGGGFITGQTIHVNGGQMMFA